MSYKINVISHSDGWEAHVPAFPEIHVERKTCADAEAEALERIPFAIASRKARGIEVPEEDE